MTTASRNRVDTFLAQCAGLKARPASGKTDKLHNVFYRHNGDLATPCCRSSNGKVHWEGKAVSAPHHDPRIAQQISAHLSRCQEARSRANN